MATPTHYDTDLTDRPWALLEPLLPPPRPQGGRGRPSADRRRMINGILYIVTAGCAWRRLPNAFGPWSTV
ncbi:MAG: transposase [Candidatus Competibacterales bacterium]